MRGEENVPWKCACGGSIKRVVDSRPSGKGIRRRRECTLCGHRITTYEMNEMDHVLELELPIEAIQIIHKMRDEIAASVQAMEDSIIAECAARKRSIISESVDHR